MSQSSRISGMDFLIIATEYLSEALSGSLSHVNASPKLASHSSLEYNNAFQEFLHTPSLILSR